ncbi:MAG: hypothetical protein ABIB79_02760 [archaeon]
MGEVFWKPLYLASGLMFILSLILIPISMKWAIIMSLALITLWTRIPGFVHWIFNSLSLHDLFAFIIATTIGIPTAILFHTFGLWGARLFGPEEWTPFTIRMSISGIGAILLIPTLINYSGGANITGFLYYMITSYVIYYLLVLIFSREDIMYEIIALPSAIFFDFILNLELFGIFGSTLSNMLKNGINSGWPFIIFAGGVMGLIFLSKNAKLIGDHIKKEWDKIFRTKKNKPRKKTKEEIEEEIYAQAREKRKEEYYSKYREFFEDN